MSDDLLDDVGYRRERKRLHDLVKKWKPAMALNPLKIHLEWIRGESPNGYAATTAMENWKYHSYTIKFYLMSTINQSDEEVERIVVHELAHCLLAPLSCNLDEVNWSNENSLGMQFMEFQTELVAKAFLWTREAGRRDHMDELKAKAKSDTLKPSSKAQGE